MVELMKHLIDIVNNIHDFIQNLIKVFGANLTDKDLHFIVIGIIGIIIFFITQALFKWLSKYSITAISFIYSFTVLTVIVFAIEIEQKITKRGNMEFGDIVAGMNGFLFLFFIYVVIRVVVYCIKKIISIIKEK